MAVSLVFKPYCFPPAGGKNFKGELKKGRLRNRPEGQGARGSRRKASKISVQMRKLLSARITAEGKPRGNAAIGRQTGLYNRFRYPW